MTGAAKIELQPEGKQEDKVYMTTNPPVVPSFGSWVSRGVPDDPEIDHVFEHGCDMGSNQN